MVATHWMATGLHHRHHRHDRPTRWNPRVASSSPTVSREMRDVVGVTICAGTCHRRDRLCATIHAEVYRVEKCHASPDCLRLPGCCRVLGL